MDLKNVAVAAAVAEPVDVPMLFDAETGEPTDGFKIVGPDSEQYQDADRKWRLRNVKRASVRGRPVDGKTDDGAAEILDATTSVQKAIVYSCVVGIYGFTNDGVPAELSKATLDAIFALRPSWLVKVYIAIEAANPTTG